MRLSRRILVVEDCENDVALLHRAFANQSIAHPIDVVHSGREAVGYIANANPLPAVVVLDLRLPDIPGFEVLRILRGDERLKGVPIVVLTALEHPEDATRAYQLGANSFLTKPISFSD